MATPRHRARRARSIRLSLAVLALVLLAATWAGWQGARAAGDLRSARDDLRTVRQEAADGVFDRLRLRSAASHSSRARGRLEDPVLRAWGVFPALGVPLETATGVARAVEITLQEAALPLVAAAGGSPAARLTPRPGAVDVDALAALSSPSREAVRALERAQEAVASTSARTGSSAVDAARRDVTDGLTALRSAVEDLALTAELGPELLGRDRPRRYLLISQSPAEARGTGGLIGGYTLVEAAGGTLRIVRSGPRSDLQSPDVSLADVGEEFRRHYGAWRTGSWIESNISPHFPYAGEIWSALWQRQFGERIDGALLLDPIALSYLLEAVGPVSIGGGELASADDIADLTLRDVYSRFDDFDDDLARDVFLQRISTAVAEAVTSREPDGPALLLGLDRAVRERRLLLWVADDDVQRRLAEEPISGRLPSGRVVGDVVVDEAGSKLDYYLERSLTYAAGCDGPSRLALRVRNAAPATGLPEYVTPTVYRRGNPPGTNIFRTTLYLPEGSELGDVLLDGQPVAYRRGFERGLLWVQVSALTLPPGDATVVEVAFEEPSTERPLQRLAQPLVRPETFTATSCE